MEGSSAATLRPFTASLIPTWLSSVFWMVLMMSAWVVCSVIARVAMSITRTPSFGSAVDEAPVAASPAMEPIIMKNMMILMMPQTASPQRTARTHLMNSFML